MHRELNLLAQEFISYKGNKRYVKYPKILWDKAVQLCQSYSITEVAESLKICKRALEDHIHIRTFAKETSPSFIPIEINRHPAIQLHVHGAVSLTIDFDRPMEDLAKLVLALQRGSSC
jgi:hypothetical protein